jgi:hypothetical protein
MRPPLRRRRLWNRQRTRLWENIRTMAIKITHDTDAPTASIEFMITHPLPDYDLEEVEAPIPRDVDPMLASQGFSPARSAMTNWSTVRESGSSYASAAAVKKCRPPQCSKWRVLRKRFALHSAFPDRAKKNKPRRHRVCCESPSNNRMAVSASLRYMFCQPSIPRKSCRYFASEISTEARVVSQSMRNEAPLPNLSTAIVKFSTAAGSDDTFISVRARSCPSPA